MENIITKILGSIILAGSLAGAHVLQEKPISVRIIETNSRTYKVKEFADKYEIYQLGSLGGAVRNMYDYGKNGDVDLLGGGPKGLASKAGPSTFIDKRHKEIYQEVFSQL